MALPQANGAVYLVRLKGEDPQCLVDPGSPRSRPECWAMAAAEAEAYIADTSGGGGKRLLLQGGRIRSYRTLTCGPEMEAVLGSDGYENESSWCSVAKQALSTRGWLVTPLGLQCIVVELILVCVRQKGVAEACAKCAMHAQRLRPLAQRPCRRRRKHRRRGRRPSCTSWQRPRHLALSRT